MIWGENLENVSIIGPGLISGKGLVRSGAQFLSDEENDHWRKGTVVRPKTEFGFPTPATPSPTDKRTKAIALKLSRNVILKEGGHFATLATGIDNVTVDNVKIDTNRDSINIDACRNARVSNMSVNSPVDDGIVLKSSYALGFARRPRT